MNDKEFEAEVLKLIANLLLEEGEEEPEENKDYHGEEDLDEDEKLMRDRQMEQWMIKYFDGWSRT